MELKKENTKNLDFNIWGELYATKEGKKTTFKLYLLLNGIEFVKEFFSKKECRDFIKAIKFYKIPLQLYHANYNCSYMDLPF